MLLPGPKGKAGAQSLGKGARNGTLPCLLFVSANVQVPASLLQLPVHMPPPVFHSCVHRLQPPLLRCQCLFLAWQASPRAIRPTLPQRSLRACPPSDQIQTRKKPGHPTRMQPRLVMQSRTLDEPRCRMCGCNEQ